MTRPTCSEDEFIELVRTKGPGGAAKHLGISERRIYERRSVLERKLKISIRGPDPRSKPGPEQHKGRLNFDIQDGVVLVGSDAHYWPEIVTTAHKAFVKFCRTLKPKLVIANGDMVDGATVSRHSPIGWENRPKLVDEIETCKVRLFEIEKAARDARKVWLLGNHDARYETRLAQVAPEYAKLNGVHLKDHYPSWETAWSLWANDDVVVKHRFRGGVHARHNNTLHAGKTMVTGHTHALGVTPFSDYNGDRWGVDTGTLAEKYGEQFTDYTEDSPRNWRSGFIVLKFVGGTLLWPQPVHVIGEGVVTYCNEVIRCD